VTSAALHLDAAVRAGESTIELVKDIRTELRSTIDVLEVAEHIAPSLDIAFARVIGTWEGICSVSMQISEQDVSHLQADPLASATVVDIVTEAVSNAVRHGGASAVTVLMRVDDDGIAALEITDDGRPATSHPASTGLGTTVLDECTLSWSREVTEAGHVLSVEVPTAVEHMAIAH